MEKLERAILEKGRKMLNDSLCKNWETGDLDQWKIWARKMKTTILNFNELTEPLIEVPIEEKNTKNQLKN